MSKNPQIHPVILCGGAGTRLWPLSRKSYPKQFSKIIGDESLFQQSVQRLSGNDYAKPLVLTNSDFRFIVTEQLAALHILGSDILIEPDVKNTAPAILAAALFLIEKNPDALMLVAPSDHVIPNTEHFQRTVLSGVDAARSGRLVTFGIKPDRPETGYGYLHLADGAGDFSASARKLKGFVEKPALEDAQKMLASGEYLWNAGIFLLEAKSLVAEFEKHAPDQISPCKESVAKAKVDLNFLRLDPDAWARTQSQSIDYAIMEQSDRLTAVPFDGEWSDLGSWEAVWQNSDPSPSNGVVTSKNATAIDCENTLLRSENENQELVGIGLKNIVAIAMPDAVLVSDIASSQKVKLAVQTLKDNSKKQAEQFPRDHRPWGWFETLSLGERFQVKRIMVHPGAALSLQSHVHRAEHWVVVQGVAMVTLGETKEIVAENQSVYIPLGEVHRLENPGKVDLHLIEVQTGAYLGEDDITRYEDVYSRS
jgi:mannose-1-phosphate guanylyltransferase/mannose-1-phosphate guanylyltransferase/mannose-6-phosphate isomerase